MNKNAPWLPSQDGRAHGWGTHPPPMRPVTFDSGIRYGDKNLRWGSPSYLIEFSDPGWVYDPHSAAQPPPSYHQQAKKHTMPKADYIQRSDIAFAAQLIQFKTNIVDFVTPLGLTTGQVTGQANDADYFNYVVTNHGLCSQCAQQWTAWKDIARGGGEIGTPPPPEPTMPTPVTAVAPGIEKRFRDLVQLIKNHPANNTSMNEALGIEGAGITGPDFDVFKPTLRLVISGGQVIARWNWEGYSEFLDLLEIQVDRGSGFTLLTYDSTPDYTDTTPFPATAAKWTYKAIFRVGDGRVGQWSDLVSITVVA
jgi:hypothetical protein